jgi:hypothetical protein
MKRFLWVIFLLILVIFIGWVSVKQLETQKKESLIESPTPTQIQEETKETISPSPSPENLIEDQLEPSPEPKTEVDDGR